RTLAHAARDAGIIVDDVTAARKIKDVLAPYAATGVSEAEALTRLRMSMGLTESGLIQAMKSQIASETLTNIVTGGAYAPETLVKAAQQFRTEERNGFY